MSVEAMSRNRVWLPATALILLLGVPSLNAQVAGTMSGYVRDQTGAAVPGATITAVSIEQQLTRTALSDNTGFYNLLAMPPGTYEVSARARIRQAGAERRPAHAGEKLCASTSASRSASVQSEVTVTSTATLVNTTSQTLSAWSTTAGCRTCR